MATCAPQPTDSINVRTAGSVDTPAPTDLNAKTFDMEAELRKAEDLACGARRKIEEARNAIRVHEQLKNEALLLQQQNQKQSEEACGVLQNAMQQRDNAMQCERLMEEARVREHARAEAFEKQRAAAEADMVMCQKQAEHAAELQRKHEIGIFQARQLERQGEFELKEAELRKEMAMHRQSMPQVGPQVPLVNQPLQVEVEVKTEAIPEYRLAGGASAPTVAKASSTIKEHVLQQQCTPQTISREE